VLFKTQFYITKMMQPSVVLLTTIMIISCEVAFACNGKIIGKLFKKITPRSQKICMRLTNFGCFYWK